MADEKTQNVIGLAENRFQRSHRCTDRSLYNSAMTIRSFSIYLSLYTIMFQPSHRHQQATLTMPAPTATKKKRFYLLRPINLKAADVTEQETKPTVVACPERPRTPHPQTNVAVHPHQLQPAKQSAMRFCDDYFSSNHSAPTLTTLSNSKKESYTNETKIPLTPPNSPTLTPSVPLSCLNEMILNSMPNLPTSYSAPTIVPKRLPIHEKRFALAKSIVSKNIAWIHPATRRAMFGKNLHRRASMAMLIVDKPGPYTSFETLRRRQSVSDLPSSISSMDRPRQASLPMGKFDWRPLEAHDDKSEEDTNKVHWNFDECEVLETYSPEEYDRTSFRPSRLSAMELTEWFLDMELMRSDYAAWLETNELNKE